MIEAKQARDAGIQKAAEHAEQIHFGWNDKAVEAIRVYAACVKPRGETFTAEKLRNSIIGACVPAPPHKRAWGSAFVRAAREGLIIKVGVTHSQAPHCHLSYVAEWKAV